MMQDMELEFIRVKKVWEGNNKLDRHMIVQATDCAASRVPITLKVEYSLPNYTIKKIQPYTGGRRYREMMEKGTKVTALLFANPRGCPVINKRLGLTGWDEVVDRLGLDQKNSSSLRSCRRGKLLNVALDDPTLLRMALSKQNQSSQESCLHLTRNMEAWREMLGINYIEKSMYHIVLEVEAKGGVAKVFYAAVVASPNGKPLHLANWISIDSPRATMNLP